MRALPNVKFLPFKGRSYGYGSPFGIPVMVLGESHYSSNDHEEPSLTRAVMKEVTAGEDGISSHEYQLRSLVSNQSMPDRFGILSCFTISSKPRLRKTRDLRRRCGWMRSHHFVRCWSG